MSSGGEEAAGEREREILTEEKTMEMLYDEVMKMSLPQPLSCNDDDL